MKIALRFHLVCLGLLSAPWVFAQNPTHPPDPSAASSKGLGDLMILPVRVVLEGRTRAGEVMLKNAGSTPATYRIFLQEMEMTPDGQLQGRTKVEGEISGGDVIRYSPHQVELTPGETQIVRIQVRKPENLAEGEYRSHMVFQAIPPAEAPTSTDPEQENKGLSISIKPIYGISIPIIVRHGETTASVAMSNPEFHPTSSADHLPSLTMELQRQGNRSVMGDIEVVVESGSALKKGTVIGTDKGVAVYTNLSTRKVTMPLMPGKGVNLKGCRLKLTLTPKDMKAIPVVTMLDIP